MTSRSHKSRPTTAPKVRGRTNPKKTAPRRWLSIAYRWGTHGLLAVAATTAIAQSNEPQRFSPPVHVQPVGLQNVLRTSGSEDLYGDDENGLRWQSADQSHRRPASEVPADNAVYRKSVDEGEDNRVQGILIKDDSEANPPLAAPIDDPYSDRKPNLRTEHGDSIADSASLRRSSKGKRRGITAGYQEKQSLGDPLQEKPQANGDQDPQIGAQKESTCGEYRQELLNQPITSLDINISAPRPSELEQQDIDKSLLTRTWSDRLGNVLAQGKLIDVRQGYVIVETDGGRQNISVARLSDADLGAIAAVWRVPTECTIGDMGMTERCWAQQTYTWKASDLCHKPLYFEDEQLERYGHSAGPVLQPIKSTAHFFVRMVTLPCQMKHHPINECQYALGFYRPGNCAPWLIDPMPLCLCGVPEEAAFSTSTDCNLP